MIEEPRRERARRVAMTTVFIIGRAAIIWNGRHVLIRNCCCRLTCRSEIWRHRIEIAMAILATIANARMIKGRRSKA